MMSVHRIVKVSSSMLQCNRSGLIISTKAQFYNCYRCMSSERSEHPSIFKSEKEKFRRIIANRYVNYVQNYTKVLEKRFPTAMHMYRVFSVGIKDFLKDLKTYFKLKLKITKDRGFNNMTRQEIELFEKMPSDMWRIAPVLILSTIPFGNYIVFPLAFMKPRKMLCSHFWSIQQRAEFSCEDLKQRLQFNQKVLRSLEAKLNLIPDVESKKKLQRVLALLQSGMHPSPKEVLDCKDLFTKKPYNLNSLSYSHMGYLLKMYGIRKGILRRNKLKYRAFLLSHMDKAIIREGGVKALNSETLRNACHLRGLNARNLSNQEMMEWLQQWIFVSQHIDANTYSLFLHCPIFFACNHPQNLVLIN